MIKAKQRDIVLLPVPFSDQKTRKVRPALVISNNHLNKRSEDLLLVPLTSVLKENKYSVSLVQKDLVKGKLIRPSRARVDKIFVVHKNLVRMVIGTVKTPIMSNIKTAFNKVMQEK